MYINIVRPEARVTIADLLNRQGDALDLNSIHLAESWLWAHFLYWPLLLWSIYGAPWSILRESQSSNIVFATSAMMFLFWHLRINIEFGLAIHLLGSTILTLMFRWQVAMMANALIVLGMTLTSGADFEAFAMNALLTGALPIGISYLFWRINECYLPANYFVYIFFAAFLSAGVSILATGYVSYQILSWLDNSLSVEILDEFLIIFIPIMYPEAFLTGAVISIFVIYKPQWIATFNDQRYLSNK